MKCPKCGGSNLERFEVTNYGRLLVYYDCQRCGVRSTAGEANATERKPAMGQVPHVIELVKDVDNAATHATKIANGMGRGSERAAFKRLYQAKHRLCRLVLDRELTEAEKTELCK